MEWRLNHVGQMAQSVQDYSDFEIQSVSDLFSILFKMEGQADLEIATSKEVV